jgi:integrase
VAHVEDRWYAERGGQKVKTARHGRGNRWRVRFVGPDGREHGKSFARKADADAFRDTTSADVHRGTWLDPDAGKITLRAFADGWLAQQTTEASTREAIETRLRRHIVPVLGSYTLAQLAARPSIIQRWVAGLGVSGSYGRVVFATLATILNAAVTDKLIASNPCRERSVRIPRASSHRVEPWTGQQVAAVRAALPEPWQVLADLGDGLGLRQGEIFGLAAADVDFLRRVVHVRRQVRIVRARLVFAPPKGNKLRDIPLPESVSLALAAHLERHPARPVILPWQEPGGEDVTAELIMTSATGQAVNRNTFNTYGWKPALAAAGIPATRVNGCHVLRHTFASVLLHHGVDVRALSEYLGHADPGFTLRTYTHLMPAAHDRMREAIDAAHAQDHGPVTAQAGVR